MEVKVFDALLEPTFVINAQSQVTYVNEAGANLLGVLPRKVVRQKMTFQELFIFTDSIKALEDLQGLEDSSPYQEVQFSLIDGKLGRVQITVQPFSKESCEYLIFMRDVTLEETLQKKYRQELEQKEGYIKELEQAQSELADYSKNLEQKVAERTAELATANQTLKALLESLGQGFFIFDHEGQVLDIATKACQEVIEKDPRGQKVWDVLNLSSKEAEGFKKWSQTLFAEMLPFEDLVALGPSHYRHSLQKHIQLNYFPLRSLDDTIVGVVTVATDTTDLVEAKEQARRERANAQLILKMTHNKRQFALFYHEVHEWLEKLKVLASSEAPHVEELFRALHSLKGGAASFSLFGLEKACHRAETILADTSIDPQVQNSSLANAITSVQNEFDQFKSEFQSFLAPLSKESESVKEISESKIIDFGLRYLAGEDHAILQRYYYVFLFEPIGVYLQSLNTPWAEVAGQLGKEVNPIRFICEGCSIWVTPYQAFLNSLVHVVRNAADHGIELPEARAAQGKPRKGSLVFEIKKGETQISIKVSDDGSGISTSKIRAKLLSLGVSTAGDLTDFEVNQYIFWPQLSSKDEVSLISGRGVGMDAVKEEVTQIGGQVWVESEPHKGTQIFIELPILIPDQIHSIKKIAS